MRLFEQEHAATTDDWYTPPWIFEEMGVTFDFDMAAPPGGVPWIPADDYYTEETDGLARPWSGFVWVNPPYSAPSPWCERWAKHPDGVILIRADLSSKAQANVFRHAETIFVATPRISFVNGHSETAATTHSSSTFTALLFGRGRGNCALSNIGEARGIFRTLTHEQVNI